MRSLKTINTNGSTWFDRMSNHIKDLGSRGATVAGNPADMTLDVRVQPGGIAAVKALQEIANNNGVKLLIKEL